jgi:protein FAM50
MAGMGDGYVGTAQDAARIRRLQKQRDQERQKILDLKKKSSEGQVGLVQFGQATSEVSFRDALWPLLTISQGVLNSG